MPILMTTEDWSAVRGKYLLEISLLMITEASPFLVLIALMQVASRETVRNNALALAILS